MTEIKPCKDIAHLIGELCFDNMLLQTRRSRSGGEHLCHRRQLRRHRRHCGNAAEPRRRNSSSTCTADDVANRRVTGLKAKGNIEVDMSWENGKLVEARVKGNEDKSVRVFYGEGDGGKT